MSLTVMDNSNLLEERRIQYMIEMSEKKTLNEFSKYNAIIDELRQEITSLRKEINSVKGSQHENMPKPSISHESSEQTNNNETCQIRSTSTRPEKKEVNQRPSFNDFKDGEISIEKFFNFGRK